MATTNCPTRSLEESPNSTAGSDLELQTNFQPTLETYVSSKTSSPYSPLNKPKNSGFSSTCPKIFNHPNPQYICSPKPQRFLLKLKLKRICQPATRGNSQNPNICGGIATNQLCLEHCVLITREFVIENSFNVYIYI